ncbi:serine/threonine-protein kinase [Streptomyces sp. HD]|uniref:serine/threonine-protein kinase n=1 Tax=Streptomyces sp. HD TaxID=3020892 RepID=UPI00232DCFB7|nr:serine/threonine-protein kinase [Streptomyces sp. HD]MDC0765816.1 serine/threonine-protein kinase [Streptomyces sp. HD]
MGTEGANFRVIAGRYRLDAKLGRGGMGVVWRATDQLLGRRVAVKELPLDERLSAADARRQRERTLREAQAVAQLSHPHVIVVHDVVEDAERPYIVMELIDGDSLADRLATHGPVDAPEAARIGVDLLSALRTAHAAGVLHRDIKPDNVLIENGTERVVLTDFGIAQMPGASTLTESGSFVGSPEYTAPERMSGAGTGPAADLWSVGALLCAALSGESPFRRDSLSGIVLAVVSDDIRPPAQAAPILPVVQGLLERDPGLRLDAAGAERMLREFLVTGLAPVPKRFSRGERTYSPRTVLATAVLVAAMAVAGVSAAALLVKGGGDGGVVPTSSVPDTSVGRPSTATGSATATTSMTATTSSTPSGSPSSSSSPSRTPSPSLTPSPSRTPSPSAPEPTNSE